MDEPEYVISDETGERVPVQKVYAVGVSANQASMSSTITAPQAARIQMAMTEAVRYCYQEGKTDPEYVKEKMEEARAAIKRLFAEEAEEAENARIAAELEAAKQGNPPR